MAIYKYNQPYYKLHFAELEEDVAKVLSFEGEEAISLPFEYRIELLSEDPELDPNKILNKKATFVMTREDAPIKIHGIISRFEQRGRTPDYVSYFAVLSPKLWRLNLTYQSEIYQHMDIAQVIEQVMKSSGFSNEDFEINLSGAYPVKDYVVQYRETNFNFLNRRLEHYGIFYFFDHRNDNDVIVFTDANQALSPIANSENIYYNPNRDPLSDIETITEITCREEVVTGLVRLKDYNYLHPEKQIVVQNQIDAQAPGMYYEYGDHFDDEGQGGALARVRNEEILAKSKVFSGTSDCRLFRAGAKFTLGKHYRDAWNDEYVLTTIRSRGTQRGLFNILAEPSKVTPTYENIFEAIPVDVAYRPARRTPVPRIPGIMSAKIESGSGDEYAFIDDHGRYRAKMLFDLSDASNGEATLPIRLTQSYSGANYGMHFPNHVGTELVWACVDGDVDRPVGIGTVPNPSNNSPAVGGNKAQSVIRTAGQNELTMDDTTGNENIYLHGTKDWTIDIVNDKNQTIGHDESASVGNDRIREVGKNESVSIGNDLRKQVGNDESHSVGNDRTRQVDNNETISIGKNRSKVVGDDQTEQIGKNNSLSIGIDFKEQVGSNRQIDVGANHDENVGANKSVSVGGNQNETVSGASIENVLKAKTENVGLAKTLTVGGACQVSVGLAMNETVGGARMEQVGKIKNVMVGMTSTENVGLAKIISAGQKIELICGKGKISIESNGKISIDGSELHLTASGPVKINGEVIDLN